MAHVGLASVRSIAVEAARANQVQFSLPLTYRDFDEHRRAQATTMSRHLLVKPRAGSSVESWEKEKDDRT